MPFSLSDLVDRLQVHVPAANGRPTSGEYENAIKDAVSDFNNRVGIRRRASLTMVGGTATYNLPSDFHSLIEFSTLPTFNGTLAISSDGLIPLASGTGLLAEEYEVVGQQITIYPTPGYSGARFLWYKAGHYLDGDDSYPNMTEADVAIIMLKARATAWRFYGDGNSEGFSYSFGSVRVDKKATPGSSVADKAKSLETEYDEAIKARIGALIRQQKYNVLDAAIFMNDLL